jgi:hypothetical protein
MEELALQLIFHDAGKSSSYKSKLMDLSSLSLLLLVSSIPLWTAASD